MYERLLALPTQRRVHPSPSGPSLAFWGIGTPRGGICYNVTSNSSPHSGEYTRVPLVPPGPFGGYRRPVGGSGMIDIPTPPHTTADTPESLQSCVGGVGDRDAPWGGHMRLPSQLCTTQWQLYPSPSSPAWAVCRIGMPRGGVMRVWLPNSSPQSGGYTSVHPHLPGPFGG